MFLLLCVCVCALLLGGQAQDQASFLRGNDRSGRCQYTFTVPSPAEASCPLSTGGPEVEGLKARLSLLEVLVARLTGGEMGAGRMGSDSLVSGLQENLAQVMGKMKLMLGEKERLQRDVEGLQRRIEEMRGETERLRDTPCPQQVPVGNPPSSSLQDSSRTRPSTGSSAPSHLMSRPSSQGDTSSLRDPAWEYGSRGFQELKAEVTEVPAPNGPEDRTGCGDLVSVGEPVSHRKADSIAGKYGVWMQDPEAKEPYGSEMIWRIDTVGSEVRQLFGYEDMDQLSKGFPSKVLLLPEPVESTGATLFRGSLYYQRRRSRTILRYDLATESIAARRDLPHAGFHGQFPYSWGGYTDVDLGVDEQGLWAIYSTNKAKGAIVLSQLDPHSLEVRRSWETGIRKISVANAFVICGKLYTLASYTSPNTTINYMYDTATRQTKALTLPFKNKYRYNSMVDYNPAKRKLFAWDNFHIVSYDVRLGRQQQA